MNGKLLIGVIGVLIIAGIALIIVSAT